MRLDLGSGAHPRDGYEPVDLNAGGAHPVDLLAYPWPWPDSSIEALSSSHFVEHVADLIGFMNEAWRVLEPGGTFDIWHPYLWSEQAFGDPTHVRFLTERTWYYFSADYRTVNHIGHYGGYACDFELGEDVEYILTDEWREARERAVLDGRPFDLAHTLRSRLNVADQLHVTLTARK